MSPSIGIAGQRCDGPPAGASRIAQRLRDYWSVRAPLVRRRWWWIPTALASILLFGHFFAVGLIWTYSVTPTLVVVVRGSSVSVGDLAAYEYPGARIGDYSRGDRMIHWVVASEGSVISVEDRSVFVDGKLVGIAKARTYKDEPLQVVAPKVIPKDHFYVLGTDSSSLDSRYEHAGLVHRADFIGRALILFEPMPNRVLLLVLFCCSLGAGSVGAVDLGVIGPLHPITEPHLIDEIKSILKRKEETGELARLQKEAQQRAINAIEQPQPVQGLITATAHRVFHFDPSIQVTQSIVDDKGQVIVAAGTIVNPLEHIGLARPMFFFDARDPRQEAHARKLMSTQPSGILPILTGGSYMDLMRRWKTRVYFDQGGEITRRFGIRQVPALVSQEGKRLRIEELKF